jgi:hypothetical protein
MNCFRALCWIAGGLAVLGCRSDKIESAAQAPGSFTVLDLADLKAKPASYDFFDFKPNVKKLILSGAPETQHVAILWYTVANGSVGRHYHAKTESVYVIDGTQTDAKGVYPTGTVYFNPPGSGHQISDSTGFFILAYASPPDFAKTDLIGEYTPVRIDTNAATLASSYPFEETQSDVFVFKVPLASAGGMSAQVIKTTSPEDYGFSGNYALVLDGHCNISGRALKNEMLVVAKTTTPQPYQVSTSKGGTCLALGVSF